MLDQFWDIAREDLDAIVQLGPRLVVTLLLLLIFYVIGRVVGRAVCALLEKRQPGRAYTRFVRNLMTTVFLLIGLAFGLSLLGLGGIAAGLLAGGGFTAIILGFAFREIGENLLAGLFLAFSAPFRVGDFVKTGTFEGRVRGFDLRQTHIRTQDGRDVFIPNAQIFNEPLENYTLDGLRRPSFTIGIDYGDDLDRALKVLDAEVRRVSGVLEDPPPTVRVATFEANYVSLEVAFWIDVFAKGIELIDRQSTAMATCKRALQDAGFTFSSSVSTAVELSHAPHDDPAGNEP